MVKTIAISIHPDLLQAIDKETKRMGGYAGLNISRSAVVCALLRQGLDTVEAKRKRAKERKP